MFQLMGNIVCYVQHDPLTYQIDVEELGQVIDTGNY